MARRVAERVFDKTKPLVARREFTANGRYYKVGDTFEWENKSISLRKVATMFSAGHIDHPKEIAPTAPTAPTAPAAPAVPAVPAATAPADKSTKVK